jgi:hypothetical protein
MGTQRTPEPSFRLSLTMTRRPSRLEAGRLLHQVETYSLAASKSGELTASVRLAAGAALAELAAWLLTSGQEEPQRLPSRPTITPSTR